MEANTDNAHIRTGRRDAPDVAAEEGRRLLEDPAFQRAYNRVRDGLIREIEELKSDGTPEDEAYQIELCRALRMLRCIRKAIGSPGQLHQLRLADFKARLREEDAEDAG